MQVPSGYVLFKTVTAGDLAPFLRESPPDPSVHVARVFRVDTPGPLVRRTIEILPGVVAGEFHRTRGHARSLCGPARMTWPALARVVTGEAVLWQQRASLAPEAVSDFLACRLKAGECALLLPDFAQGFVNDGADPAWIEITESRDCRHEHAAIRDFRGPAYYPAARGGALQWTANVRYAEITTPRHVAPREVPELGLAFGGMPPVDEKTHPWLADPATLVDDLGKAYDYFTEGFSGGR